ncbi:MAG TPA: hypothetical protein VHW02_07520 [Rhizomicrobium sp.]|jgi:hypothetical protein|nr:hypothetical protein [Rhizomicrobium sp.]
MSADIGKGESPQVRTRAVVLILAGILALLVLVAFGFETIFQRDIGQTFTVRHSFPAPAVIPDERAQRLALQAAQRRQLNGAGGRMPIDRAMKAIAAKGAHAFDPVTGAP